MSDYYPPFEGEPDVFPQGDWFSQAIQDFAESRRFLWLDQIIRELAAPWKEN
jgi:hypothetical protein